jgi:hypothetical protein
MTNGACVITITVTRVGGHWVATASPDPASAFAGQTIEWDVDGKPEELELTVGELTLKSQVNNAAIEGPFEKPSSTKIRGKVKAHGFAPTYKYDIFVGNQLAADPDIQIKER